MKIDGCATRLAIGASFLCVMVCTPTMTHATPSAKAFGDATVIAAERIGERGRTVVVPVSVFGDGATVRFSAQVRFDASRLTLLAGGLRPAPETSCTQLAAPDDDIIEISNAAQVSQLPIPSDPFNPNGRTYCDLTFQVIADAPGGDALLEVLSPTCFDEFGAMTACQSDDGRISVSSLASAPRNGGTVTIAGREVDLVESRLVLITNLEPEDGATLVVSDCIVSGQGFRLASAPGVTIPPSPLAGSARGTIGVECDLPESGSSYGGGQLECQTSDSAVPQLQFPLECVSVPPGQPLPADQIQNAELRSGDQFGTSTAVATDISDDPVVVVGAPFGGPDGTGEVYVLEQLPIAKHARAGHRVEVEGVGIEGKPEDYRVVGVLRLPEGSRPRSKGLANLARFGGSVGFSSDRSRLAIGSPGAGSQGRGQVIVVERPPGGWSGGLVGATMLPPIEPPITQTTTPGEFGANLSFNDNGELVVGAPGTSVGGMQDAGAVYVYVPLGGDFDRDDASRLTSPTAVLNGRFGESVAADADTIVVGAPNEGPDGEASGSAYAVKFLGGLVGQARTVAPGSQAPGDRFGSSVAVRRGVVVVGSSGADTSAGANSGRVVVFGMDGDSGDVEEVAELLPEVGEGQGAGARVALNDDLIVVGAPFALNANGLRGGQALVFDGGEKVRPGSAGASPRTLSPKSVIDNRGGGEGDRFATSIAINSRTLLLGAPLFDRQPAGGGQPVADVGRADPFELAGIFRSSFE